MSVKWIHNNKRSITVFLVVSAVVLAMSFFGIDVPSSRQQRYAIKIGDEQVTFEEFQKEKRQRQENMLQQYKKILGDNYTQFAEQIYNMPNQEIVDDIIAKKLIIQDAKRLNLYVGEQELVNFIKQQVFQGNFSSAAYSAYLSQVGLTARAFEDQLRTDLLLDNYRRLLTDFADPSEKEVENFIKLKETKYNINYLEFDPKNFEDKVKVDDAELEKFYTANQTDFEIPAKVSYKYINLSPESNMNLVDISEDDIQFYYSENESNFTSPEEVKVKHIQINIPKDSSKAKMDEIKAKAEEVHSKAAAGENFDLLVAQYSEDMLTSATGGSLGWVKKGKMDAAFDEAVFPLKKPGIAPLVDSDFSYQIVKVEEYKESALKSFEEVRGEIEKELKKREAPAFISAKAHEIYESWEKSDKSIESISQENKFNINNTVSLLEEKTDPNPLLKGLTKTILGQADLKKQIVEIGDNTVLVEIEKYEESKIPPFAEAKEAAAKRYRQIESVKLAKEAARNAIEQLKSEEGLTLEILAKKDKSKLETVKDISRAQPGTGITANAEIQSKIFATQQANAKPTDVLTAQGKFYLVDVAQITPPDQKLIQEKLKTYKGQTASNNANILVQANLNRLKAATEIDVDKTLLGVDADV